MMIVYLNSDSRILEDPALCWPLEGDTLNSASCLNIPLDLIKS